MHPLLNSNILNVRNDKINKKEFFWKQLSLKYM